VNCGANTGLGAKRGKEVACNHLVKNVDQQVIQNRGRSGMRVLYRNTRKKTIVEGGTRKWGNRCAIRTTKWPPPMKKKNSRGGEQGGENSGL